MSTLPPREIRVGDVIRVTTVLEGAVTETWTDGRAVRMAFPGWDRPGAPGYVVSLDANPGAVEIELLGRGPCPTCGRDL